MSRALDHPPTEATFLIFDERPSDSSFVERVWRCHSSRSGQFHSIASSHWEIVVTRHRGQTTFTLRGPETRATRIDCPADGEWLGIRFKLGTYLPQLPVARLRDRNDVILPNANGRSFWLGGSVWECPSFENAEIFVAQLVKNGLVSRDIAVEAALRGESHPFSSRTTQRHFRHATGMTRGTYRQIERARHATNLLRDGISIADVVQEAGFFDQAHLTRSLKRLIGQTPLNIARGNAQLSFLYNTALPS